MEKNTCLTVWTKFGLESLDQFCLKINKVLLRIVKKWKINPLQWVQTNWHHKSCMWKSVANINITITFLPILLKFSLAHSSLNWTTGNCETSLNLLSHTLSRILSTSTFSKIVVKSWIFGHVHLTELLDPSFLSSLYNLQSNIKSKCWSWTNLSKHICKFRELQCWSG